MGTKSFSNSALRVAAILDSFTQGEAELTSSEISHKAGLPKSTVHHNLTTSGKSGLLMKNENTGEYAIGPK